MSPWESALLGAIQGATEFLPVSSSGHLVMGQALLGIELPGVLFEVIVHLATLLSIVVAYRGRLAGLTSGVFRGQGDAWRYLGLLVLATIPAAVVGLLWGDRVEALFDKPVTVGIALFVTGGLLWSTRKPLRAGDETRWKEMAIGAAVAMGIAQSFALVPGISRSGATVVAGLWLGIDPREAAAFSFLMALPAIAGAAILELPEIFSSAGVGIPGGILFLGGAVAAVTGVLAIRTFVAMLRHRAFHHFAVYCWLVGGGFLTYLFLTG
ncbi:MAG: undecaprenyl-diphosphate phosphatase [Longimicrobiales bacterium]|nr:undecaprenyl-diphosphate phosphatase [Longimicrobiales bacterium]